MVCLGVEVRAGLPTFLLTEVGMRDGVVCLDVERGTTGGVAREDGGSPFLVVKRVERLIPGSEEPRKAPSESLEELACPLAEGLPVRPFGGMHFSRQRT